MLADNWGHVPCHSGIYVAITASVLNAHTAFDNCVVDDLPLSYTQIRQVSHGVFLLADNFNQTKDDIFKLVGVF